MTDRPGDFGTIDRTAVAQILDQFPDASDEAGANVELFAASEAR
jgi:hypothetical protein